MTLQDWEHMMKHSFESNSASQFDLGKHSIFVAYDFALEISWWDNIEEPPAEDPKKSPLIEFLVLEFFFDVLFM